MLFLNGKISEVRKAIIFRNLIYNGMDPLVAAHERFVCIMEISQHLVTYPASNEVDGDGVDVPR